MLTRLTIRDIVLIERLDLVFYNGLCVLTGETGAGKSILLDALGLVTGGRSEARLVRNGAQKAQVTAVFETEPTHPVRSLLAQQDILVEPDELILLRRTLTADGRSRAFVNDQPIGVGLMRQIGAELIEIQGQFDQHGITDPNMHARMLDRFGGLEYLTQRVRRAHIAWQRIRQSRIAAEADYAETTALFAELTEAVKELDVLAPQPDDEQQLSQARSLLKHAEQVITALDQACRSLSGGQSLAQEGNAEGFVAREADPFGEDGVEGAVARILQGLNRIVVHTEGRLTPVLDALERAAIELGEARALLYHLAEELTSDPDRLEQLEERLFALRACARKHGVTPEALSKLHENMQTRLRAIVSNDEKRAWLIRREEKRHAFYQIVANRLTAARLDAKERLDPAIMVELAPLKLEKARFITEITPLEGKDGTAQGMEKIQFLVTMNVGTAAGPLGRIASGGERSRFLLAMAMVLNQESCLGTLVFDEVDSGIGGATAAAVGDRLAQLAKDRQLLVVTHSPQVAAKATQHYRVEKQTPKETESTITQVIELNAPQRREEIARMLSGTFITNEARAAAAKLLESNCDEKSKI